MCIAPDLLAYLESEAQRLLDRGPACHDWEHTVRVRHTARHLCRVEGAHAAVVDLAAIFHDIGRPDELADEGRTCHAARGAELARDILTAAGVENTAFIEHVAACVRTHRYRQRTDESPGTLEAKIIFDADKLDSIGAIGIGRSFHFAGRIGARVHNRQEKALEAASYSREDSAYREYLVKLRHVHERMLTTEGRRMAASRHHFMVEFFARLNREAAGEDVC